jgi:hypothetical protein
MNESSDGMAIDLKSKEGEGKWLKAELESQYGINALC